MSVFLALSACAIAILGVLQSLHRAEPEERRSPTFLILIGGIALAQISVGVAQLINTVVVKNFEQKRLERETALALWAYTDDQVNYLVRLTKSHPYILGYYQYKHGMLADAHDNLQQSIDADEYVAPARYIQAVMIRQQNGDLGDARKLIADAIDHDPDYSALYVERAIQELRGQEISAGLSDLKKAVDMLPVHCASLRLVESLDTLVKDKVTGNSDFAALWTRCKDHLPPAPSVQTTSVNIQ